MIKRDSTSLVNMSFHVSSFDMRCVQRASGKEISLWRTLGAEHAGRVRKPCSKV